MSKGEELELVLDRISLEYPALVKEAFMNKTKDDLNQNMASMNETHCWILSSTHLYIWERTKGSEFHRTATPVQLPLPPSGLQHSSKCVAVYPRNSRSKSRSVGVLVVSREGVARHWPSLTSKKSAEVAFELDSEVVLSVELADPPKNDRPASFLLTTTSGTIHFLRCSDDDSSGSLESMRLISREATGIRRRLSSIIFGSSTGGLTSPIINTVFVSKARAAEESHLVLMLSTNSLLLCDLEKKSIDWTLKSKFFTETAKHELEVFERAEVSNVQLELVDAANFRDGVFVLVAATHEENPDASLILVFIDELDSEAPIEPSWSAIIPLDDATFSIDRNMDVLTNNMRLMVPRKTAESATSERTDGVIVLNSAFVLSVYVPDNFETSESLQLCKSTQIPHADSLLGTAMNEQYCYVLMLQSGVSAVRLLPRGFTADTVVDDDEALSDMLTEMVNVNANGGHPAVSRLLKAFVLFGEKKMAESSEELKPLMQRVDVELTENIYQFLKSIIDYSDPSGTVDVELQAKKVFTFRMLLFLRHMGLYDKVANARVTYERGENRRTGASMLAEMNERVGVALALRDYQQAHLNKNEMLVQVARLMEKEAAGLSVRALDDESIFFGELSLIHVFPVAMAALLRKKLTTKGLLAAERYDGLHAAADMLIAFADGVANTRTTAGAVDLEGTNAFWTTGGVSKAYEDVAAIMTSEMRSPTITRSESSRLAAYASKLVTFHLRECGEQPDGHRIIVDLFDMGDSVNAINLAETFKDFKILVKVSMLSKDAKSRQRRLDMYKRRFVDDDFEMYLCRYLKERGYNELLLEQRGSRVDDYLNNYKELRYSREIANGQYGKAAHTLANLAASEKANFDKFALFLSKAKTCALAANGEAEDVLKFCARYEPQVKHRRLVPEDVVKMVYPGAPETMMTINQLVELNLVPNSSEKDAVLGHLRALALISDLMKVDRSSEIQHLLTKVWCNLLLLDEWTAIKSGFDVKRTQFGSVLAQLVDLRLHHPGSALPSWDYPSRVAVLPDVDEILEKSGTTLAGAEKAPTWIRSALATTRQRLVECASRPRVAFYEPDVDNGGPIAQLAISQLAPIFAARQKRLLPPFCQPRPIAVDE